MMPVWTQLAQRGGSVGPGSPTLDEPSPEYRAPATPGETSARCLALLALVAIPPGVLGQRPHRPGKR